MSAPENWRFETKQIHSGAQPDPVTKARATPIYQTTSYVFDNATTRRTSSRSPSSATSTRASRTRRRRSSRSASPPSKGGTGALLLASGQAAETIAVLNIAEAGDHIVSSSSIYGGTYNLFKYTLQSSASTSPSSRTRTTQRSGAPRFAPTPSCSSPRRSATRRSTSSTSASSPTSRTRTASRSSSTTRSPRRT